MDQDPAGLGAPEGAQCAEHPDRPAQFTCPRCGSFACAVCWLAPVERCARCMRLDPTSAAAPIPWEAEGRSALWRYCATLASAFSPLRSAPAFARPDVRAAQRFALLSAAPFAWLAGIIPHTRTLLFKGNLQVQVLGHPSAGEIALDVARAGAVQLTVTAIELLCLLLPFVSLVRAYAPNRHHAAARVLYYRMWLLPAAWLVLYTAFWSAPGGATTTEPMLLTTVIGLLLTAVVLLLVAMWATARLPCGLGAGASVVMVIVPAILVLVVQSLLDMGVARVLPQLAPGSSG